MNQLQSDYWITSPPFFVFMKSQFLRPITNGFITSRSQTYPQFGIIRRTGGERLREGKEELPFQLFREGSQGRRNPHDDHKNGEAEPEVNPEKYIAYVPSHSLERPARKTSIAFFHGPKPFRKR